MTSLLLRLESCRDRVRAAAAEPAALSRLPPLEGGPLRSNQCGERFHQLLHTGLELCCVGAVQHVQQGGVVALGVSANRKMSFFAGMECHLLAVSMRWVCSLDYPLLVGLKPVKS